MVMMLMMLMILGLWAAGTGTGDSSSRRDGGGFMDLQTKPDEIIYHIPHLRGCVTGKKKKLKRKNSKKRQRSQIHRFDLTHPAPISIISSSRVAPITSVLCVRVTVIVTVHDSPEAVVVQWGFGVGGHRRQQDRAPVISFLISRLIATTFIAIAIAISIIRPLPFPTLLFLFQFPLPTTSTTATVFFQLGMTIPIPIPIPSIPIPFPIIPIPIPISFPLPLPIPVPNSVSAPRPLISSF